MIRARRARDGSVRPCFLSIALDEFLRRDFRVHSQESLVVGHLCSVPNQSFWRVEDTVTGMRASGTQVLFLYKSRRLVR